MIITLGLKCPVVRCALYKEIKRNRCTTALVEHRIRDATWLAIWQNAFRGHRHIIFILDEVAT
jgi:hypothetical protein